MSATTEPRAWLVRGSKNWAYDLWMLENGYTGVDFSEIGSLSSAADLPSMRLLLAAAMPGKPEKAIGNYAAQLNAFANRMAAGDIVVLPLRQQGRLAFGIVTGGYEYLAGPGVLNHVRSVDWKRPDVARTAINQDLLYSLGAFSTVVQISRNDAAYRLGKILGGADADPGARPGVPLTVPKAGDDVVDTDEAIASDGQDIEQFSRDRILGRLRERFDGYEFQGLVAALLEAEGMTCKVPPKGKDGGIDIIAGSGVLGISAPTIIVQVKAQAGAIGSQVLDQLGGVVSLHNADHGLLVSLSELTKDARDKVAAQQLKVAVWDAEEVLRRLLKHYEVLPDDIKAKIPLKRVWLIDEGEA
ncbi:restriction endonuclease [Agromyces protaetiae]|uniref:Restriction endonuclease n=1 Tax=Agromyces protaetiae TaxID=2509455 RepID=A0A4P6FJD7_9MICO|nr:restriction endonuclease [Agromyces protaetiae]QAY74097.1 restriction endonuclease [Agromyces protaetiae]